MSVINHRKHRSSPHRRFVVLISPMLGLIIAIMLLFSGNLTAVDDSSRKPNIILIMADDLGYECLTVNGGQSYRTPSLDRLASQGMRFEQCWSQPLCTPSRVQIMTGIYNARNYIEFGLLDPKATTFGNILKNAGYITAICGKWQLGTDPGLPLHFGFDQYCLWNYSRVANRYANPGLDIDGKFIQYTDGEYGPDIVNRYAIDFITTNKDQPFFLYYPMILPHYPFDPTPDSPDWNPKFRRRDRLEKGRNMTSHRHFADMVAYADKMVANVLVALDTLGLTENTLVIFTGDNGTLRGIRSKFKGGVYIGGKGLTNTHGDHVPMIVRWPGRIQPGTVTDELFDFSDMLPTLADAANVTVPTEFHVDGQSAIPLLTGAPHSPRRWIYTWYQHPRFTPKGPAQYVQNQRYKLYHTGELYDIHADPQEKMPLSKNDIESATYQMFDDVIERYRRRR